jgi:tagatose-1,6-bisphosphate aldolase non-catalytic subunit AgaZ/GatZ
MQYEAIRTAGLRLNGEDMIQEHIRAVLRVYAAACGVKKKT